jgi:hypothetical protein
MLKAGLIGTLLVVGAGRLGQAQTQQTQPVEEAKHEALAPADRLSQAQQLAFASVRSRTKQKAAPVAATLAATVKESFENMLSDQSDPAMQEKLCKQATESISQLITIANQGMQEGAALLTPEQRQRVRSEMGKPGAPGDLLELIAKVYGIPER